VTSWHRCRRKHSTHWGKLQGQIVTMTNLGNIFAISVSEIDSGFYISYGLQMTVIKMMFDNSVYDFLFLCIR